MRRPFITTLTLLATACSSSSGDDGAIDATSSADSHGSDTSSSLDSVPDAAEGCPAERPIDGSSCSAPKSARCSYADPCPNAPTPGGTDTFECIDHIWTVPPSSTYAIPCPSPMPTPGDVCLCAAHMPVGCIVAVCADLAPSAFLICDDATKSWRAQEVPCNPPPPDADVDVDETDADGI